MIFIGIDDTDSLESRGTGRLARQVAAQLVSGNPLLSVTRHQLLVDPRIPYTAKNSCAAICLGVGGEPDFGKLFERTRALMQADFVPGSDPGLCLATVEAARDLAPFGQQAQRQVLDQEVARCLAREHGILLEALGGNGKGVIGALAAVGLAASGEDGRYIWVGRSRELSGLLPVQEILEAGIDSVLTLDGKPVEEGLVLAEKLRPARRAARPVLFVEWAGEYWKPLRLD